MEELHALEPTIIVLFVGILAILIARPLRLSPIVGFLLLGVLIGPHALGLVQESATTHLLAELGVVFLLFDIGLNFSLGKIWDARRELLGLGPLQVLLCTAVFAGLAIAIGTDTDAAIVIGATLALSSTAVVVATLSENNQQNCPIGATSTAVLIFQDICAIFLLMLASSLGNIQSSLGVEIGMAALKAAVAFVAAVAIGRFLIGPLFRLISRSNQAEIFTATTLLIVLATAAATGLMGLSLTLGAFLGGMIISETPYRHLIRTEVKPFRGLLLGFFFITVGMSLDTRLLYEEWISVLLAAALLLGIKILVVYLAALVLRVRHQSAIQLAFLLAQGSEFAFVLIGMASVSEPLGIELSAILITAVALSMALTPPLAALGRRLASRLANQDWQSASAHDGCDIHEEVPVIIYGMGEIGQRVADGLEAHDIPYTAIESDYGRFVRAERNGYRVAFGDTADLRLAETMEIAMARTIAITVARYEVSRELTPIVRERYPDLRRFVSVSDDEERERFEALGMRAIVMRSAPEGIDMAAAVLQAHDVDEEKIQEWIRRQQDQALESSGTGTKLPDVA